MQIRGPFCDGHEYPQWEEKHDGWEDSVKTDRGRRGVWPLSGTMRRAMLFATAELDYICTNSFES